MAGQQYWLNAINVSRIAGKKALELTDGATTSWKIVVTDPIIDNLPDHNPTPPDDHLQPPEPQETAPLPLALDPKP